MGTKLKSEQKFVTRLYELQSKVFHIVSSPRCLWRCLSIAASVRRSAVLEKVLCLCFCKHTLILKHFWMTFVRELWRWVWFFQLNCLPNAGVFYLIILSKYSSLLGFVALSSGITAISTRWCHSVWIEWQSQLTDGTWLRIAVHSYAAWLGLKNLFCTQVVICNGFFAIFFTTSSTIWRYFDKCSDSLIIFVTLFTFYNYISGADLHIEKINSLWVILNIDECSDWIFMTWPDLIRGHEYLWAAKNARRRDCFRLLRNYHWNLNSGFFIAT